jgi:biotin synthase
VPGQSIYLKNGKVYVDGQLLREPYLLPGTPTYAYEKSEDEFICIGKDELFVMGDNGGHCHHPRRGACRIGSSIWKRPPTFLICCPGPTASANKFKGNKIHLCSIVNAKAGACSENCSFCAQSSFYQTGSPKYGFVDPRTRREAAEEANKNSVTAVGLVAAWKGLERRPDAGRSLRPHPRIEGRRQDPPRRLAGHHQKPARRRPPEGSRRGMLRPQPGKLAPLFPRPAPRTPYDDRLETIGYLKKAGIKICSGGIIGMGETREDRCDLAFELKEIGANVVPVNILNPIPGTPFEKNPPLPVLEILKTIACFRFILPRQEIMIAGGRTVNLRDAQSMIFMAGASALMVGNYLTTLNQPVEKDLQMLKDLGLDPNWDSHGFSDQEEYAPR